MFTLFGIVIRCRKKCDNAKVFQDGASDGMKEFVAALVVAD